MRWAQSFSSPASRDFAYSTSCLEYALVRAGKLPCLNARRHRVMKGMESMELIVEQTEGNSYLASTEIIDVQDPAVQKIIADIRSRTDTDVARAQMAFEYVRDHIQHSFDVDGDMVTIRASDVLGQREGICFAKAHLLGALLRGLGIAAGFCYQRVTRRGTPESGYALHGLNAVYFKDLNRWVRLDPRGDKPGVHSEFSLETERLAYDIHPDLGEIDYPYVFIEPLEAVVQSMNQSANCKELFYARPSEVSTQDAARFIR